VGPTADYLGSSTLSNLPALYSSPARRSAAAPATAIATGQCQAMATSPRAVNGPWGKPRYPLAASGGSLRVQKHLPWRWLKEMNLSENVRKILAEAEHRSAMHQEQELAERLSTSLPGRVRMALDRHRTSVRGGERVPEFRALSSILPDRNGTPIPARLAWPLQGTDRNRVSAAHVACPGAVRTPWRCRSPERHGRVGPG
jgi:hypothetical protein